MIYFSEFFGIDQSVVDQYGAFDVALVNDLPLFIDPFLLFDSKNSKYKELHAGIIKYLIFLRDRAQSDELTEGNISQWLLFKEVKQNWLGFSKTGNGGTGLGPEFARALAHNLKYVFQNFGNETLTKGSHIEKLGLLSGGVGRDHLSDFTTNLIKGFLLKYTENFAVKYLKPNQMRDFLVERVSFDYDSRRWQSGSFKLPFHAGDFVILTPCEILARDESWINQGDMVSQFFQIRLSIPDEILRTQINEHFLSQITETSTQKERKDAALSTIEKFNQFLDLYIKNKEESAGQAHILSGKKVHETHKQFVENIRHFVNEHLLVNNFGECDDSYDESLRRAKYLKQVIENNDGYRVFYVNGAPIKRESDLQIMFRLTWRATSFDVNSEVNNGRGPVDYKISKGKQNASLVEFKLASNTSLYRNLQKQVEIYAMANETKKSIKVIMYFSDAEFQRVSKILEELNIGDREDIVLIDASRENKVSGSKA